MTTRKALAVATITALVGAFGPTLLALRMMADNNNNGELYDTVTGRLDVGYALSTGAVFYLPSALLIFAAVFVVAWLWGRDQGAP